MAKQAFVYHSYYYLLLATPEELRGYLLRKQMMGEKAKGLAQCLKDLMINLTAFYSWYVSYNVRSILHLLYGMYQVKAAFEEERAKQSKRGVATDVTGERPARRARPRRAYQ